MTETKWEPSDELVYLAIDAYLGGDGWRIGIDSDEGQFLITNMRSALIAAVEADPLLRAAGEMQSALRRLSELTPAVANARDARDLHLTVKAIADTALAKSHGED